MQEWHYKWIICGILVLVALSLTGVGAYTWRGSGEVANSHSIAGLWVSLIVAVHGVCFAGV